MAFAWPAEARPPRATEPAPAAAAPAPTAVELSPAALLAVPKAVALLPAEVEPKPPERESAPLATGEGSALVLLPRRGAFEVELLMALESWSTLTASVPATPVATPPMRRLPAVPATLTNVPSVAAPTVMSRVAGFCCTRPMVPLLMLVVRLATFWLVAKSCEPFTASFDVADSVPSATLMRRRSAPTCPKETTLARPPSLEPAPIATEFAPLDTAPAPIATAATPLALAEVPNAAAFAPPAAAP